MIYHKDIKKLEVFAIKTILYLFYSFIFLYFVAKENLGLKFKSFLIFLLL